MKQARLPSATVDRPSPPRATPSRRGVSQASPQPGSVLVPLAGGQMCSIEGSSTFVVHCASGLLWITSPAMGGDVVLSGQQRIEMPTRGKLLITAVSDSALWLPPEYRLGDQTGLSCARRLVRTAQ